MRTNILPSRMTILIAVIALGFILPDMIAAVGMNTDTLEHSFETTIPSRNIGKHRTPSTSILSLMTQFNGQFGNSHTVEGGEEEE